MKRREFLGTTALTAGATMLFPPSRQTLLAQARRSKGIAGAQGATPATPKLTYPTRTAKVEILFKAPGLSGNGMQCTEEGIWTIDIAGSRGDTPGRCKVYLSSYEGKMIREMRRKARARAALVSTGRTSGLRRPTAARSSRLMRRPARRSSSISPRAPASSIGGPPTSLRVRTNTARRRAPKRRRPEEKQCRRVEAAAVADAKAEAVDRARPTAWALDAAERSPATPGRPAPGTGAHGIQVQGGKLWVAVPPGRMIYRINPTTWTVEHMFPTTGFRPHGIGIENEKAQHLWESDTNMGAFMKRDMVTGEILEAIVLPDGSPFPHGASVYNGYIYWVDDIGGGMRRCAEQRSNAEGSKVRQVRQVRQVRRVRRVRRVRGANLVGSTNRRTLREPANPRTYEPVRTSRTLRTHEPHELTNLTNLRTR